MVKWPEVRKSLAHENGEGQCGAAEVRDEKTGWQGGERIQSPFENFVLRAGRSL